jgi:hypothetical protein
MKGKYNSLRDSALHYMCINGWSTGEFGDVQDFGAYVWRVDNKAEDVQIGNTEFWSMLREWWGANGDPNIVEIRDSLVGHFIVLESDQGFVSVIDYNTEEELVERYNPLLNQYTEWREKFEDED